MISTRSSQAAALDFGTLPVVALDVTVAATNAAGSGRYTQWLAADLAALMGDRLRPIALPGAGQRTGAKTLRSRLDTLRHDVWWTQSGVRAAARRERADVLHAPTALAPMAGREPLVVTIHDVSVLRFPERFPRWFRTWARFTLPKVARHATAIITDSAASRDEILHFCGVGADRITVVPLGIPPRAADATSARTLQRVKQAYGLDAPFVLTVGSLEPRKNIPRLLRAVRQLRGEPRTRDLRLVHAGPRGWLGADIEDTLRELQLADAVRFLGYVPDDDLPALYALARITAYPSLYEGFGLPIVEAMASGSPVLTSSVSSMPEVAGKAAVLVDPESTDAIAEGLRRLWTDEALRSRLIVDGRTRAARFTSANTARLTLDVYRSVAPR